MEILASYRVDALSCRVGAPYGNTWIGSYYVLIFESRTDQQGFVVGSQTRVLIRHTFCAKADRDDTHLCDPTLHNIKTVIVNTAEEVKDIIEKPVKEAYSQLKTHLLIF